MIAFDTLAATPRAAAQSVASQRERLAYEHGRTARTADGTPVTLEQAAS